MSLFERRTEGRCSFPVGVSIDRLPVALFIGTKLLQHTANTATRPANSDLNTRAIASLRSQIGQKAPLFGGSRFYTRTIRSSGQWKIYPSKHCIGSNLFLMQQRGTRPALEFKSMGLRFPRIFEALPKSLSYATALNPVSLAMVAIRATPAKYSITW